MVGIRLDKKYSWPDLVEITAKKAGLSADDGFKSFMMSKQHLGYHFDALLWRRLYRVRQRLEAMRDSMTVITGDEGAGKSTLGVVQCQVMCDTFQLKNICLNAHQFITNLQENEPGSAVLLDEGLLFMFSRETMSKKNRDMTKIFSVMRAKRQYVVICVPNYYTMDAYVRNQRVKTILHVLRPGSYMGYTGDAIHTINEAYKAGIRKLEQVKVPIGSSWYGSWNKGVPTHNDISWESYNEYKNANLNQFLSALEKEYGKHSDADTAAGNPDLMTLREIQNEYIPRGEKAIMTLVRNKVLKAKKVGLRWYFLRESVQQYVESLRPEA